MFSLHFCQAEGLSTGQCKHIPSVHYRDLVFRSGYLRSEGWLQYRAPGIRKAYSVEVKVALPRNELVYLSGPCQLNICLGDFLQFMKRGILKNLGEGLPCLTSGPVVGSCIFKNSSEEGHIIYRNVISLWSAGWNWLSFSGSVCHTQLSRRVSGLVATLHIFTHSQISEWD